MGCGFNVTVCFIHSLDVFFDEIVQAFADVGNVLYVEKMVRNNGPTIVHFTHPISMAEACQINCIAGYTVFVMPVSQKDFQRFVSSCASLKKAAKGKVHGTSKFDYLHDIEAKEEQEKMDNIIFKTAHNPHYRNPNPNKYSFEGKRKMSGSKVASSWAVLNAVFCDVCLQWFFTTVPRI